jgi:hypothetical protein
MVIYFVTYEKLLQFLSLTLSLNLHLLIITFSTSKTALFQFLLGETEDSSARLTSVSDEIRTAYLPNESVESYRYISLLVMFQYGLIVVKQT